jgi:hypothetical protein
MKLNAEQASKQRNVTAEPLKPWRRPPSCWEASNKGTGGEHRGTGDGMRAKEQVVNTGNPIWWEERSQPELREEQTGPDGVAERSVVAMKRVTTAEQRDLSSRVNAKSGESAEIDENL